MRFKNLERYRTGGTGTRMQLSIPSPRTPDGRAYRYSPNEDAHPRHFVLGDAVTAYDLATQQIDIFSIGTGNAPFALSRSGVFAGMLAWRQIIKAAMFLTTDNATAQAKLLLGPDRCLRIEPEGEDATVEMDDYDDAFSRLPDLAARDFEAGAKAISRFFDETVFPREKYYTTA
jgi:hypothetical protein